MSDDDRKPWAKPAIVWENGGTPRTLGGRHGWPRGDIMGYHHVEGFMSDVLIRDVPDDVLAALDQQATRLGLSRTEYIRRRLAQDARTATISVTADDWRRFADAYSDLANPAVMDRAWE